VVGSVAAMVHYRQGNADKGFHEKVMKRKTREGLIQSMMICPAIGFNMLIYCLLLMRGNGNAGNKGTIQKNYSH